MKLFCRELHIKNGVFVKLHKNVTVQYGMFLGFGTCTILPDAV